MPSVAVGLSPSELRSLAARLRACVPADAASELSEALAREGEGEARLAASPEVAAHLSCEEAGRGEWRVVADTPEALFTEFGTGVPGRSSHTGPVPAWFEGWDLRRTPQAHWSLNPEWWFYRDEEGRRRLTPGQVSTPFMQPAADAMREAAARVAKEVLALDRRRG